MHIALRYRLQSSGSLQIPTEGLLVANVDNNDSSYQKDNLSALLRQITATHTDGGYELSLRSPFIMGIYEPTKNCIIGITDQTQQIKQIADALKQEKGVSSVQIDYESQITVTFVKDDGLDGVDGRAFDYFEILSNFIANQDDELELSGYSRCLQSDDVIAFNAKGVIEIIFTPNGASYIELGG